MQIANSSPDGTVASLAAAALALERATDILEMQQIRDAAEAAALYAKRQELFELAQAARILVIGADRKMGVWLRDNVDHNGGNPNFFDLRGLPDGIKRKQSMRLQTLAGIPQERVDQWIDECIQRGWEINSGGLLNLARARRAREHTASADLDAIVERILAFVSNYPDNLHELIAAIRRAIGGTWR